MQNSVRTCRELAGAPWLAMEVHGTWAGVFFFAISTARKSGSLTFECGWISSCVWSGGAKALPQRICCCGVRVAKFSGAQPNKLWPSPLRSGCAWGAARRDGATAGSEGMTGGRAWSGRVMRAGGRGGSGALVVRAGCNRCGSTKTSSPRSGNDGRRMTACSTASNNKKCSRTTSKAPATRRRLDGRSTLV